MVDFMHHKKCIIKLELDFVTFQVERDNHILGSMEIVIKKEIYAITYSKLAYLSYNMLKKMVCLTTQFFCNQLIHKSLLVCRS